MLVIYMIIFGSEEWIYYKFEFTNVMLRIFPFLVLKYSTMIDFQEAYNNIN